MTGTGFFAIIFILAGLALVGFSGTFRLTSKPAAMTAEDNDHLRFVFFLLWTLALPLVLLFEWWGLDGWAWSKPPDPFPPFAYARKVISDVWTAVALALAALAWNKKPEHMGARRKSNGGTGGGNAERVTGAVSSVPGTHPPADRE